MSDKNLHDGPDSAVRNSSGSKSLYFGLFTLAMGFMVLGGWMLDIPGLKSAFGVVVSMVFMMLLLTALVWWTARELNRIASERQQSDVQLHESEERYRRLFEAAKDGILLLDYDTGVITDVNPFLKDRLGYSKEELLGKCLWELGFFKDVKLSKDDFLRLQNKGYVRYEDLPLETKEGKKLDVEFISNVYQAGGKKVIQCNIRDITERKRAEEEIKFRNVLLSTQQEASIDGILVVGENNCILSYNRRFIEMWRLPEKLVEDKVDTPVLQFVTDQMSDPGPFIQRIQHLYSHRQETSQDELILADGRFFDRYSAPMFGPNERYYGRIWNFRDITERKRREKEREKMLLWQNSVGLLQQSLLTTGTLNQKLKNITDEIVRIFDVDICRIWVIQPGDLCQRGCVHAQVKEGPHACLDRSHCLHLLSSSGRYTHIDGRDHGRIPFGCYKIGLIASGKAHKFLTNDVPNDPHIHDHQWAHELGLISFAGYQLHVPDGQAMGVMAVFAKHPIEAAEDTILDGLSSTIALVIQQAKGEEEREKLETQLRQSQKLESIGQLAGGVAHDFNNMLSVINGYSEMLLREIDSSDTKYERIREINKAGTRSADLTRQLLAFARRQPIAPKVLDINEEVEGMLKMLRRLLGENIELVWKPSANLWKVKVDSSQISQILVNLLVNARDAVSGAGKIVILTCKVELDAAFCRMHLDFVPGKYVVLEVCDSGCGMDKKTREHIFEPFFTTKKTGEGTGLGLATVFGIVKQNEGFINVYSEPGKGTTFKIYLPRHEQENVEIEEKPAGSKIITGTETVLLVEDENSLLVFAKAMLERLGYTVLTANSPSQAIKLAEEYKMNIHLLMTDMVMPEMSGLELRNRITSIRPGIKCLFMSGYTADIMSHNGILDEGINFLEKPFTAEELSLKLREALAVHGTPAPLPASVEKWKE